MTHAMQWDRIGRFPSVEQVQTTPGYPVYTQQQGRTEQYQATACTPLPASHTDTHTETDTHTHTNTHTDRHTHTH